MSLHELIRRRYVISVLFIVTLYCLEIICSTMLLKSMQNLLFEMRDANVILFGDVSRLNALIYSICVTPWIVLNVIAWSFFGKEKIDGGFCESLLCSWLWVVGCGEGEVDFRVIRHVGWCLKYFGYWGP